MKRFLALALALAAVVAFAAPAAAQPVEVEPGDMREAASAEIFMRLDATDRQIKRVRDVVEEDEDLVRFAQLDQEDALRDFREIFAGNPEAIAKTSAEDLPASFRLQIANESDRKSVKQRYERMPGVEEVVAPRPRDLTEELVAYCEKREREALRSFVDVEVYMDVHAPQASIDAVRAALDAEPDVLRIRYFDKQAALKEFKRIFRKDPDLVRKVSADSLPVSFRVRLPRGTDLLDFAARFEALSDVDDVATPEDMSELNSLCELSLPSATSAR